MPTHIAYPMVLNNVYIGMVDLRTDHINYFNIPDATTAELQLAQYRTSGTNVSKNIYSNRLDSPNATRQVTVNRTARTKTRGKFALNRGGKVIKIPTELRSTPPSAGSTDANNTVVKRDSIRFTSMKFPGKADLAEISAWVHLKLIAHKPKYIKSPGGRAYPVVPFGQNVATGESTTT